jgi:hypothetical protein
MKKIILSATVFLFAFSAFAQSDTTKIKNDSIQDKYCVESRNNKAFVMHRNTVVTIDVTLRSGDIISADGKLKKLDGSTLLLVPGDCVDQEGKVEMSKTMGKIEEK